MASGRFAVATHALALLARAGAEGARSDEVAASINTHPVLVRRVLATLRRSGLVDAREGRGGGYTLALPAARIRLADVYRAVEPDGPIAPSPCTPSARCRIGAGMRAAFEELAGAARDGLLAALATTTIADVADRAEGLGRSRRAAAADVA